MLFEKKEYKERLKKVKDSMQKQGIDLLVSHDPNILRPNQVVSHVHFENKVSYKPYKISVDEYLAH